MSYDLRQSIAFCVGLSLVPELTSCVFVFYNKGDYILIFAKICLNVHSVSIEKTYFQNDVTINLFTNKNNKINLSKNVSEISTFLQVNKQGLSPIHQAGKIDIFTGHTKKYSTLNRSYLAQTTFYVTIIATKLYRNKV